MKTLYIIAGCNGAGKTTAAINILPETLQCREFVNADEIAKGLSPFNPEGVAIEAGRLMLRRIDELIQGNESFSIETTLATKSYSKLVARAHENGFRVILLFFWLTSPQAAIDRVAERVAHGGHNIPIDVIKRRYATGIQNLFDIFMPIVDSWTIFCNSLTPRRRIAEGGYQIDIKVYDKVLFSEIKSYAKH